jgi:hypothetical protein
MRNPTIRQKRRERQISPAAAIPMDHPHVSAPMHMVRAVMMPATVVMVTDVPGRQNQARTERPAIAIIVVMPVFYALFAVVAGQRDA